MPAAIAIPLITAGASAATGIVGAKMASNAAKGAAKTQADAAKRAEVDSRRASADALAYIERMRTGGPAYAPGSTQGYLSTLLGVPQRPTGGQMSPGMLQPHAGQAPGAAYAQLFGMGAAPRAERRGVR